MRLIRRVTEGKRFWVMQGFFPGSKPPYATVRWYADRATGEYVKPVDERAVVRRTDWRFKLRFAVDESPEVVKRIFNRLEAGDSLRATADALNRDGVPSPTGSGRWGPQTVRRIARNPIYRGVFIWGRTTRSEDPVPARSAEVNGTAPILVEGFLPDPPRGQGTVRPCAKAPRRERHHP